MFAAAGFISLIIFPCSVTNASIGTGNTGIHVIDQNDTIVFDLANGISGVGFIEFPVYFISDDTINSVDFAFRFNQSVYTYDTVYSTVSSLSYSAYLNPGDSTLRFTSFSIPVLGNYDNIAWVRLLTTANTILESDFNSVESYLNGNLCSYKFTDGTTLGIEHLENNQPVLYPNPADNLLYMTLPKSGTVVFSDLYGKQLIQLSNKAADKTLSVDVSSFSEGIYFVTWWNHSGENQTEKMLISRSR
jgi:hypothetical protein